MEHRSSVRSERRENDEGSVGCGRVDMGIGRWSRGGRVDAVGQVQTVKRSQYAEGIKLIASHSVQLMHLHSHPTTGQTELPWSKNPSSSSPSSSCGPSLLPSFGGSNRSTEEDEGRLNRGYVGGWFEPKNHWNMCA